MKWTAIEGTDIEWMVDTDGAYYERIVGNENGPFLLEPEMYSAGWRESEVYKMLPASMRELDKRLLCTRILLFSTMETTHFAGELMKV